jgi:Sec-independent protein translocase protein TatA
VLAVDAGDAAGAKVVPGPERLPGILDCAVRGARGRREAMRQVADLRRRRAAAQDALVEAHAASKRSEEAFDAANDRFDAAERVLDTARQNHAQARRDRYAARRAYERASATAERLARRERELSGWLAGLTSAAPRRVREKSSEPARRGVTSHCFRAPAPQSRHERTLMRTGAVPTAGVVRAARALGPGF